MKKFLFTILLFALSLEQPSAQIVDKYSFPEGTTLSEAKLLMENDLRQIQLLKGISLIGGFSFGSALQDSVDDANIGKSLEEIVPKVENLSVGQIKEALSIFFNQIEFSQKVAYPQTYIYPQIDNFTLSEAVGVAANTLRNEPNFTFTKIYYSDGSILEGNYDSAGVPDAKPVDSIMIDILWSYPKDFDIVSLSSDNPEYRLADGSLLKLQYIEKQEAFLTYEGSGIQESLADITMVIGRRENGKYVESNGRSYSSLPEGLMNEVLSEMGAIYEGMIGGIDADKFKDSQSIADSLNTVLLPFANKLDSAESETKLNYQFDHSIKDISFLVPKNETYKGSAIIRNWDVLSPKADRATVAQNTDIEKYGIVDVSGNWIVEPEYDHLSDGITLGYYEGWKDNETENMSFVLDRNESRLEALNYLITSCNESGIFLAKNTEGKQGAVDSLRNDILPFKFSDIVDHWSDSLFVCYTYGDGASFYKELYDYKGEKVLAGKYFGLDIKGDIVSSVMDRDSIFQVITQNIKTGEIVEQKDIDKSEYMGNQFLFREYDFDTDTYNFNSYSGYTVIKGTKEYDFEDYEFIGQRSIVRETDDEGRELYGFVDIKGKLVVPIIYDKVEPFEGSCTYVEKGGKPLLIDQNNELIRELPSKLERVMHIWYSHKLNSYSDESVFLLDNGAIYSLNGEFVE